MQKVHSAAAHFQAGMFYMLRSMKRCYISSNIWIQFCLLFLVVLKRIRARGSMNKCNHHQCVVLFVEFIIIIFWLKPASLAAVWVSISLWKGSWLLVDPWLLVNYSQLIKYLRVWCGRFCQKLKYYPTTYRCIKEIIHTAQ